MSIGGGFASHYNLTTIKSRGVTDVCFAKKRGLAMAEMTRSRWIYDMLLAFASALKRGSRSGRVFGLARFVWKGAHGFHAYVRTAVLAANVLLRAR